MIWDGWVAVAVCSEYRWANGLDRIHGRHTSISIDSIWVYIQTCTDIHKHTHAYLDGRAAGLVGDGRVGHHLEAHLYVFG